MRFTACLYCFISFVTSSLSKTSVLDFGINIKDSSELCFQENKGQFNKLEGENSTRILFKAQSLGLDIFITEKGLTYLFSSGKRKKSEKNKVNDVDSLENEYSRFDIDLKGGRVLKDSILKEDPYEEVYNFFYGHCRHGIMGVMQYKKLTIKNVYPGIDWILYGSENKGLKYDFIVHVGADPNQISLLYKSLNPPIINEGNLELPFSSGLFCEKAPLSYLESNERQVNSEFLVKALIKKNIFGIDFYETEIGFKLQPYPKKETLVIDPLQLWWGTYYGGTKGSEGVSITTDSLGNVFVLGNTDTPDLPVQSYGNLAYFQGTYGGANNGGGFGDSFILKFTNMGQLLWATYFGGSFIDRGAAIRCDKNGNIFVTGLTYSLDFPLKNPGGTTFFDSTNASTNGVQEIFVSKFSSNGHYLWGTYYGSLDIDIPTALEIDANQDIYITGTTTSSVFPLYNPGNGTFFQSTFSNGFFNYNDAFILKFANSGQLLLSTYFGGSWQETPKSIACDRFGNVFFAGHTSSPDLFTLNPGGGAYFQNTLLASGGNSNGYLLKLNAAGQPLWSTYFGGCCSDGNKTIACDGNGNLFLTGVSASYNFPLVNPGGGAYYLSGIISSAFLSKFNPQSQLVWSTRFRGAGDQVIVGKCGEIYVTAPHSINYYDSIPVKNPGNGAYFDSTYDASYNMGLTDIFISAFSNNGAYRWGTFFGGQGLEANMMMASDTKGNIFYTGQQGSYYYNNSTALQSYSSCIVNPGNGAYFQSVPLSPTSTLVPPQGAYPSCVVGKFTPLSFNSSYSTAGCGSTNSASIQTLSGWGPYSYTWSTGSHADSIANIPQGTYSYTITDHFFGCTDSKTVFLGLPSLSLSITGSNASICKGRSAQFIVSGANSFSWMPPQTLNASSGATVTASPLTTTNYTVTGYNSPTCSSDSVINLIVHPLPIITVLGKDSVCKGSSVTYSAFGAVHYSWTPEQSFGSVSNSTAFVKPQQDVNGTIIGKDNNNCVDSTHFRIHVIPLPQMQVTGSRVICLGSASTLTASGAEQFIWAPFTNINYRDSAVVIVSPKMETSYTLTGINAKSCKDSLAITISILQLPEVTIMAPDSACSEVDFNLKATGSGEFSWGSAASINCFQCQNATAQINTTTSFFVTLTDTNQCSNKDSLVVHLKPDCEVELIIPNIFTPNNDMVNDVFKLRGKNITTVICHILNRWGTHVYSFDSLEGFWNGDLPSGKGGADGVYFYVIYATDIRKEEHVYKGSVQLIR